MPAATRDFYAGVLANRKNRLSDSLGLLEPLLRDPTSVFAPEQRRAGLRTIADGYFKLFRYGDAVGACSEGA